MQINLDDPTHRLAIAETIHNDVDEASANELRDGFRRHLGGSQIGKSCNRELWYAFRWVKKPKEETQKHNEGQMLRLLNRGHREEPAMIRWLQLAGCIIENDPQHQVTVSAVGGHFGGSIDNTGFLPPKFQISKRIGFEFKTANIKNFAATKKKGVKLGKPDHWAQMCVYGFLANIEYFLYVVVNKDNDELYFELVKIDMSYGQHMVDKAAVIISAKIPPIKISERPEYFGCKWCKFTDICHHGEVVEKNCRSCKYAVPGQDKTWICTFNNGQHIIPDEIIVIGCSNHKSINDDVAAS